ncbi:MAG: hypothetical protein M3P11_12465 [Actinomycetota bacterium]|nr:hypothetical protein [Actinomycetota bacterium]
MFRQRIPDLGLSIEMGTDAVPDDGQYYVTLNQDLVFSSGSQVKALSRYRELRDELTRGRSSGKTPHPAEILRKLKADAEISALLAASSQAKRSHATHRRGGVARWKSG